MKDEEQKKWFVEVVNPRGQCPAMRHDGRVVIDSENIVKYGSFA